jgi:molybdopterin/thiamine biosynthesis adenylyltransferase
MDTTMKGTNTTPRKQLNSMRHVAIHNPADYADKVVTIIGVGTIGSWLVQILSRMQVNMVVYDHDTVEEHNITTQTYGQADIGKHKVAAIEEQIKLLQPESNHMFVPFMYPGEDDIVGDVIVSCVDSLVARKQIAQTLIDAKVETPIIDGRVGREQGEVYFFDTASAWLAQLPEEADTDPCGARFTAYTAVIVAGFMANNVKRFLLGQTVQGRIIYDAASSTFIKE